MMVTMTPGTFTAQQDLIAHNAQRPSVRDDDNGMPASCSRLPMPRDLMAASASCSRSPKTFQTPRHSMVAFEMRWFPSVSSASK